MAGCARSRLRALLKLLAVLSACLPSRSAATSFQYAGQQGTWPVGVSRCSWDETSGRCKPTYAALMTPSSPVVKTENYPARAEAQLAAGKLYCGQFKEAKCQWPCQWNGEECALASTKIYGCWDCPGSLAYQSKFCNQLPNAVADKCNKLPGCEFIQPTTPGSPPRCDSIFFAGKDPDFTVAWYTNYYSLVPREYVGCCKGSNYRWLREKSCQIKIDGDASVAKCKAKQGCFYDDVQLICTRLEDKLVDYAFSYDIKDPAREIMMEVAKECMAIKDSDKCNNHAPVKVHSKLIQMYLEQELGTINMEVADAQCKPQPNLVAPIIAAGSDTNDGATPWPTAGKSPAPGSPSQRNTPVSKPPSPGPTIPEPQPSPRRAYSPSIPKPRPSPRPSPKPSSPRPAHPPWPSLKPRPPASPRSAYGYAGSQPPTHLVQPSPHPQGHHSPSPHHSHGHHHHSPSHHMHKANSTMNGTANGTRNGTSPELVKLSGPKPKQSPSPSPKPQKPAGFIPSFIPGGRR